MPFQIPSNYMAYLFNKHVGRKFSTIFTLLCTGLTMVILIFVPKYHWASTTLGVIGVLFISATFTTLFIYTSELFPTTVRSIGMGLCATGSKAGAMIAPFVASMTSSWLPSVIFASTALICVGICLILPETRGQKLKDTIIDTT